MLFAGSVELWVFQYLWQNETGEHKRGYDGVTTAGLAVPFLLVGLHLGGVVALQVVGIAADCGTHGVAHDCLIELGQTVVAGRGVERAQLGALLFDAEGHCEPP